MIMAAPIPPPRSGELLVLPESDYRYGIGPVEYRAEPWWSIIGEVANGSPANSGGWIERHVYVREGGLPSARAVGAPR